MLCCSEIQKSFGGVKALDGVSLSVDAGEVVGLIGPNGSGKSTLVNVITGFVPPDRGSVTLDGRDVTGRNPSQIRSLGIARTFQNLRLYEDLTLLDNVLIGLHLTFIRHSFPQLDWVAALLGLPSARQREAAARETAMAALAAVKLDDKADRLVASLSYGDQKRLELARVTAIPPKALILDEPTAGMAPDEAHELISLFRADIDEHRDRCLLLIEHRLDLVLDVCDRVVVLDSGRKIAEGLPEEIAADQDVMDIYVGRR